MRPSAGRRIVYVPCQFVPPLSLARQNGVVPGRRYFFVYILTNISRSVLYTGVTRDLRTRVFQHRVGVNSGFAHRYRATRLVWYEVHESPTSAIRREKQIKAGGRKRKVSLIVTMNPKWQDLAREL